MSNKIVAVTFVSENMCEFMVNGGEFTHFAVRGLGRGVRQIGDGKMETISTCSGVTAEIPRSSNTILGAPYVPAINVTPMWLYILGTMPTKYQASCKCFVVFRM